MDGTEFLEWLRLQKGVARCEIMPPGLLKAVAEEESGVVSSMGTPVDNSGLRDCMARENVYVAFVEYCFWIPDDVTMLLRSSDGTVVGHDIPAKDIPAWSEREDVMFLSEDFVIYSDREMSDAPYMEMLSQKYRGGDGSIPDGEAILWYPSPSSNDLICGYFSQPCGTLATAIVGYGAAKRTRSPENGIGNAKPIGLYAGAHP